MFTKLPVMLLCFFLFTFIKLLCLILITTHKIEKYRLSHCLRTRTTGYTFLGNQTKKGCINFLLRKTVSYFNILCLDLRPMGFRSLNYTILISTTTSDNIPKYRTFHRIVNGVKKKCSKIHTSLRVGQQKKTPHFVRGIQDLIIFSVRCYFPYTDLGWTY